MAADRELARQLAGEHDITSSLTATYWSYGDRVVCSFEQKSGRYDGEHFALVMSRAQWAQMVADILEFNETLT